MCQEDRIRHACSVSQVSFPNEGMCYLQVPISLDSDKLLRLKKKITPVIWSIVLEQEGSESSPRERHFRDLSKLQPFTWYSPSKTLPHFAELSRWSRHRGARPSWCGSHMLRWPCLLPDSPTDTSQLLGLTWASPPPGSLPPLLNTGSCALGSAGLRHSHTGPPCMPLSVDLGPPRG